MSSLQVVVLECPQCGAPVQKSSNICNQCFSEYMVKSIGKLGSIDKNGINKYLNAYKKSLANSGESPEVHCSMGICFLKLGLYDFAIKSFDKAIDLLPEDGDVYFYAAISLLKGKKAFMHLRDNIDKIQSYLEAALEYENKAIYYYFYAYIKYDYFYRKHFITSPTYSELLTQANDNGILRDEIEEFFELIKVSMPDCLAV